MDIIKTPGDSDPDSDPEVEPDPDVGVNSNPDTLANTSLGTFLNSLGDLLWAPIQWLAEALLNGIISKTGFRLITIVKQPRKVRIAEITIRKMVIVKIR